MKNKLSLLYVLGFTALSNYVFSQCANSGIGTTSPGAKLEVRGCTNDSTTAALKVANSTDTTNNPILFIRNDNRIGIGTKFPQTMLDVNGTIFSRQGFKFPDGTVQTTATGAGANIWSLGSGQYSIINNLAGGNITNAISSFIGAGLTNTISVTGNNSIILGGQNNYVGDDNSVILSGSGNTIQDPVGMPGPPAESYNFISGGIGNTIHSNTTHSAIIQGYNNSIISGVSNVVILGGTNIAGVQSNTVYMPNICVTSWIGSGDRTLVVDSAGNLRVTQPIILCGGLDPFWKTNGNNVPTGCAPFIGPTSAGFDFIIKTGDLPSNNNFERMRVKETGEVGIGINSPQHNLHLHSDVLIDLGDPNNPILRHANCCLLPDTTLNFDSTGTRFSVSPPSGDVYTSLSTFQITDDLTRPTNLPPTDDNGLIMGMNGRLGFLRMQEIGMNFDISSAGGLSLSGEGNRQVFLGSRGGGQMMLQTGGTSIFMTPTMIRLKVNNQFAIAAISNGNVGIGGILTPTSRLQVQAVDASTTSSAINVTNNTGASLFFVRNDGYVGIGTATPQTTPQAKLDVNGNGYFSGPVAINTATLSNPFPGNGYMLAVKGKIIAEEYVAKLTPWPDYVFKKDYKLKDLNDLDQFIKEKEHLPGIPTATEAEKNGVSLGEMAKIQMEKIEELTLYMIQMNKEIQLLKAENEKLNAKLKK